MQLDKYIEHYISHFFGRWIEIFDLDESRLFEIEARVLSAKAGVLLLASRITVDTPYPESQAILDAEEAAKQGRLTAETTDEEAISLGGHLVMLLFFRGSETRSDTRGN